MHFGDRKTNRLEHALRGNRPEARDAFVAELRARVGGVDRPRRSVPRLASALALTVALGVAVAALGGLSYAGTAVENTAASAVHTIKQVATAGGSGPSSSSSHQFAASEIVYPTLTCTISPKYHDDVQVKGTTSDPTAGTIFVTVTWDSGQPYGTGSTTANNGGHWGPLKIHGSQNAPGTTYTATVTQDGSTTTCTAERHRHHHHDEDDDNDKHDNDHD